MRILDSEDLTGEVAHDVAIYKKAWSNYYGRQQSDAYNYDIYHDAKLTHDWSDWNREKALKAALLKGAKEISDYITEHYRKEDILAVDPELENTKLVKGMRAAGDKTPKEEMDELIASGNCPEELMALVDERGNLKGRWTYGTIKNFKATPEGKIFLKVWVEAFGK